MSRWRPVTRIVRFPIFSTRLLRPKLVPFWNWAKAGDLLIQSKIGNVVKVNDRILNFAAKRFGESSWAQKTFDRAFQGLSIGLC
jgi:hypothetical protein